MLMTRHDAAGSGLGLFAFLLLLVYFHRRTPPPQGGAAMVPITSTPLQTIEESAVPVEVNDDPVEPKKFHRPQGGAAILSVSLMQFHPDDGSAVPVEITDDERTDPVNPEEFRRLVAFSESPNCAIPAVIEDPPTVRVAPAEIAHLAEQSHREDRVRPVHLPEACQLEEPDLDALLLDMEVRARRRTGEAVSEYGRAPDSACLY